MAKNLDKLPEEFKYLDNLLKDAMWLILTELERRGALESSNEEFPREITLKINIGKHKERLPVESEHVIKIGKAHTEDGMQEYSVSSDMGFPDWYYSNPLEYWETEATVDYLQVKPGLV